RFLAAPRTSPRLCRHPQLERLAGRPATRRDLACQAVRPRRCRPGTSRHERICERVFENSPQSPQSSQRDLKEPYVALRVDLTLRGSVCPQCVLPTVNSVTREPEVRGLVA